MRQRILVIGTQFFVNIQVRIDQHIGQNEGEMFLKAGVEVTASVQENALHATSTVFLDPLLHHGQNRIGGNVIVEITNIVPDIDGLAHLLPLLHQVEEMTGCRRIQIIPCPRIIDGGKEDTHIVGQRFGRRQPGCQISRNEEVVFRETFRQFFHELRYRRRRIPGRIADSLATRAHADDGVVIRADGNPGRGPRAVPVLVQDIPNRKVIQFLGRKTELVLISHASGMGEQFLVHVLETIGGVVIRTQHTCQLMAPEAPVVFQVVQAEQPGHVRILVGRHVNIAIFEREGGHRIFLREDTGRQVCRVHVFFVLADIFDELIDQPGHRPLIFRRQIIGVLAEPDRIVSPEIVSDMERNVAVILVFLDGHDCDGRAFLQMSGQIIGHLHLGLCIAFGMNIVHDIGLGSPELTGKEGQTDKGEDRPIRNIP